MSRFDDCYDDGEGLPWEMWQTIVSRALGGRRGQQALADMETALMALPEPRLIEGHLAADGAVCAVGAYVAHKKAAEKGVDVATIVEAMNVAVTCWCGHPRGQHDGGECSGRKQRPVADSPCDCDNFAPWDEEGALGTADAGQAAGLTHSVAWHLAQLNDEKFRDASPEERYRLMLAWVRRAQGKPDEIAA